MAAKERCTHALLGVRAVQQPVENAKARTMDLTLEDLQAMGKAIEDHSADIP